MHLVRTKNLHSTQWPGFWKRLATLQNPGLHADRHIATQRCHKNIAPVPTKPSAMILTSIPQETSKAAMLFSEVSSSSPEGRSRPAGGE